MGNELLLAPLQQTPHGHLTAFCLTFSRSPLIITLVLFILNVYILTLIVRSVNIVIRDIQAVDYTLLACRKLQVSRQHQAS